jgi:hypothetical protein
MATPLGVYLTTGRVSGGASTLGLMLTGMFMATISITAMALIVFADSHLPPLSLPPSALAVIAVIPEVIRTAAAGIVGSVLGILPLLLALRLSPIAGYHAAEHQVVHAIERGEPLLPEAVRAMPRVHPRCGTNIVAAVFLAMTVFTALAALPGGLNLVAAGLAALLYMSPPDRQATGRSRARSLPPAKCCPGTASRPMRPRGRWLVCGAWACLKY